MWKLILVSVGLVFVLEGVLPFLLPQYYQALLLRMSQQSSKKLRVMGLVLMIIGVVILLVMRRVYNI